MSLPLPDKHVRKAVFTALDPLVVDGDTIPVFDTNTTGQNPNFYVLMTTQTNNENFSNKCQNRYSSSILIDVVTRYDGAGNTGSRLKADDIMEAVRSATQNLALEASSGLKIILQRLNFPNDLSFKTETENVFRKLMRIEFEIESL